MQNPKDQNPNVSNSETQIPDTRQLTPFEIKVLDQMNIHHPEILAKSLQFVHDMTLYHTDILIQTAEKEMLYDVIELSKVLRETE